MTAQSARNHDCEVIVIGAGPYGLAVAAHLRARGVATLVFGEAMSFWRRHMPKGMFLRSPWGATHISDPPCALTLDAFLAATGGARVAPLPLETFIAYGKWVQAHAAPDLDPRKVERIETASAGFRVIPTEGKPVHAPRVVVAMGLAHQEFRPDAFAQAPRELVSHSSDHESFDRFRGKRVGVIGRGQSACESAVLLREAGAEVGIVCRGPIHWLSDPKTAANQRAAIVEWLASMLATPSGVGPFPLNWVIEFPALVHLLP
jgi:cation diffusion facilitator CzcD-associated flavoprotein CzcO